MSFFFNIYVAYLTNVSWSSCMRPISFLALRVLKFLFNWLKTNSMGLYLKNER